MLRDAICSLLGWASPLFCTKDGIAIPSIRDRLHPGERELCKRIAAVAQSYISIKNFVDSVIRRPNRQTCFNFDGTEDESTSEPATGFYLLALCEHVNAILEPYHQEISELEIKAIRNPDSVTLSVIVGRAERYSELFRVLNYVFQQIKVQNIHGCALLNFLYPYLNSGTEDVEYAFRCLVHGCQIVMVNQLSKWLIYGCLEDVHNEFFIQKMGVGQPSVAETEKQLEHMDFTRKNQLKGLDWTAHFQYRIEPLMLPKYIKPSLASKILYIGRMIQIFGHDPDNIMRLGIGQEGSLFTVWGGREAKYFSKLQSLQGCNPGPLNMFWLEEVVDELRGEVMKHMWRLIKEDARLLEEISLMKDIFMLGRGELFQELIIKTEGMRHQTFNKSTSRDVQAAFKGAVHKVLPNDETIAEKFQFCCELPYGSDEDVFKEKDGWWHFMSIKYRVQWPFQLMFKPIILDNYNIIFKFLFRLKKGLIDLHNVWHGQMKMKHSLGVGSLPPTFWLLQHKLMNLLNNIQYYLQVSVLEALYKNLQTKVQQCVDIEEIYQAHMNFQASVMSQFFLTMRQVPESKIDDENEYMEPVPQTNPVHKSILLILQVSEKFCSVAKLIGGVLKESEKVTLDKVFDEFETSVTFFMELLTCAQDHHLLQLCAMLDFNEQFSFKSDRKETKYKPTEEISIC